MAARGAGAGGARAHSPEIALPLFRRAYNRCTFLARTSARPLRRRLLNMIVWRGPDLREVRLAPDLRDFRALDLT